MATACRQIAHRQDDMDLASDGATAATRLCGRITTLEAELPTLSLDRLMQRIGDIRGTARLHGLSAVMGVSTELVAAIGRDGRAALIRPYLTALREACGCAPGDENAVHALLASISVRFAD